MLVLGFFDGVHRGHQEVINTGKKIAKEKNLKLAVMTFNQHPAIVFQQVQSKPIQYLSTLKQKEERMSELGVDLLYEVAFTSSFAALSPQEFVDQYVVGLHEKWQSQVLITILEKTKRLMPKTYLTMRKSALR